MLNYDDLPSWLVNLESEDLNFIKRFILNSGSLKDMAKEYGITYPTIRQRLDRMIEKIKLYDKQDTDSFIEQIKALALDGKIEFDTAKQLISEYRKMRKRK